ncbi:MAG: Gfo/Idh/MocA family oxidoreductase [Candidatus Euphemobacter frigidus]|nr:Gfo/Idh/MocA family oxidoreductase [Candidatus Euphemobacter frigidus]
MDRETIALIGYGYWGQKLYRYLRKDPGYDLKYVYFRSLKDLSEKDRVERYGGIFTPELEIILDDPEVRGIIVATPIKTHFEIARQVLSAGKNLLIEKPLTLKREEALILEEIASRKKLTILTDYIYTFSKSLEKARGIIREGVIGEIHSIQLSIKQTGRFLEYDVYWLLASHLLAVLDMFVPLDELNFNREDLIRGPRTVESGLIHFLKDDGSFLGYIDVSLNYPGKEKEVVIYGEKGSIIYNPSCRPSLRVMRYRKKARVTEDKLIDGWQDYDYDESNNIGLALKTFRNCLSGRREDNLKRAIAVTMVLENL